MKKIIILLLILNILPMELVALDKVVETYDPYKTVKLYRAADRAVIVKVIEQKKAKKQYKSLDEALGYSRKQDKSKIPTTFSFEINTYAVKFEVLKSYKGNDKQGKNFVLNTFYNNPYDSGNDFLNLLSNEDIVIIFFDNKTVTKQITSNSEDSALEVMNKIVSHNYIDAGTFSISQTISFEEQELVKQLNAKFSLPISNSYYHELGSSMKIEDIKPFKITPIFNR